MSRLVAIDLPPGPAFVDALQQVWEAGDAALPVDGRLPSAARADLMASMGASAVVHATGESSLEGGSPVEPGDAVVVATSGTTGNPKGALLTHDAVAASARITSAALDVDPANDRWLCCLPVAHIGGLSVITRALHTGTPLEVHGGFDSVAVERAAAAGATLTALVVTAFRRIRPDGFRRILLGGSAIPTDRPAMTVATYGMTETGSGIVYEGWPLAEVELRIVDDEVHVRSPTLLRCYRDGTDPFTADGWFPTGDAGALDADGKLTVRGRIGDVIVTGGEKVWPVAVERAIDAAGLPGLGSFTVIGRPSAEWGEEVTVVAEPGRDPEHPPPALDELRERLRDHLPAYALPRRLEIVDELPTTALGKVRRDQL